MKWKVEITETLQRGVEIEAESAEDAERQVRSMYLHGDIVLDASNYVDVVFDAQQLNGVSVAGFLPRLR